MQHAGSDSQAARRPSRRRLLAAMLAGLGTTRAATAGEPELAAQLVQAFDTVFAGPHAGLRAVHGNGWLCEGGFTPAAGAASLSIAPHLAGPTVPALVRFSNFAAVPGLPDTDPAASPRGMAIRFLLPDGGETDIVAHSYDGFPAATPAAFLRFLRAVPDAARLAALAAEEPAVRRFLAHPKPPPVGYTTEAYFGVTAFVFVDAAGRRRAGRYRILPEGGPAWLTPAQAAAHGPRYLGDALRERLATAPARFTLAVQLAAATDRTEDGSQPWPQDRPVVTLGTLTLDRLAPPAAQADPGLRFVPTSLVAGIELSDDPMLLSRTLAYDVSAERRAQP